jgi:uncharacterized protein YaeQ
MHQHIGVFMLYRFNIELSDVDKGVYESLSFQLQQHPSEVAPYLLTRVLAYALSYQQGLEFSAAGLADPEAPALKAAGSHGNVDLWIEIGNPSAKKLHKAGKTAKLVRVYTYKSADVLMEDLRRNEVHRLNEIEVYAFSMDFLTSLEKMLIKNNRWSLLHQQGRIDIASGEHSLSGEVRRIQ